MDEKEHVRFFCCIGNPPYQEDVDTDTQQNKRPAPLYNSMMDECFKIAHKVEFITPARFLFDAGKTPKDWNKKMLSDEHLKIIDFEADSSKVFPNADIKGGVTITYRDDTRTYTPIGTFIPFDELKSIAAKVKESANGTLDTIVTGGIPYWFTDALKEEHPEYIDEIGRCFDLRSNIFIKMHDKLFFDNMPDDSNEYVGIVGRNNGRRTTLYIKKMYVGGPENFNKWKVILPESNGSGALGEVLSTPLIGAPLIGAPLIGHTQTFISIGCFDTENEAQACMKYIKTKFARVMLGILKVTQHNSIPAWRYVPLQDFTPSSDIDWSQSIADIDRQLYAKYGLSDNEIAFIEEHVKAME